MRKVIFWGAALIGGYLVLKNGKAAIGLTNAAGQGGVNVVKAFQGR